VKQIIHNNKFDTSLLNRFGKNTKQRQRHEQENQNKRWVKFTYVGRETRYITKLFRNTSFKVAYTTNNNLGKLLEMQKPTNQTNLTRMEYINSRARHATKSMLDRLVDSST